MTASKKAFLLGDKMLSLGVTGGRGMSPLGCRLKPSWTAWLPQL